VAAHLQRVASHQRDLATVIEAWRDLQESIKAGVLAMLKTTRQWASYRRFDLGLKVNIDRAREPRGES
jgi:hypothetical protein